MCCKSAGSNAAPYECLRVTGKKGAAAATAAEKAFRFEPSKEQITQWMGYLRKVSVCDSRIADRACPKTSD